MPSLRSSVVAAQQRPADQDGHAGGDADGGPGMLAGHTGGGTTVLTGQSTHVVIDLFQRITRMVQGFASGALEGIQTAAGFAGSAFLISFSMLAMDAW